MKQYSKTIDNLFMLEYYLSHAPYGNVAKSASSVLCQLYVAESMKKDVPAMLKLLEAFIPGVVIVGSSSCNTISDGLLRNEMTVVSLSFFSHTKLKQIYLDPSPGEEANTGKLLQSKIAEENASIKGALIFTTVQKLNTELLFANMKNEDNSFPIFGGCALASNLSFKNTFIITQHGLLDSGIVVVLLLSETLSIKPVAVSGWQIVGRRMYVTKVSADGHWVEEIDGKPAIEMYEKYLGIEKSDNFVTDTIEFPCIVKRDAKPWPVTATNYNEAGHLLFSVAIYENEPIWLGYGNPEIMLREDKAHYRELDVFAPEAIFLYPCIARLALLQDAAKREICSFENLAHSSGMYTLGEITGTGSNPELHNCLFSTVALREGPLPVNLDSTYKPDLETPSEETSIVFTLIHLLNEIAEDYESVSRELTVTSKKDLLTNLPNRRELNRFLSLVDENDDTYGMIMLDIDHFKLINDAYGHETGDRVLQELSSVMTKTANRSFIGRWGGEEFLIITLSPAIELAEMLRASVEAHDFKLNAPVTVSLGAGERQPGETGDDLFARVDDALYVAKTSGRNQAVRAKTKTSKP